VKTGSTAVPKMIATCLLYLQAKFECGSLNIYGYVVVFVDACFVTASQSREEES
jgi:hypothetical protein